VSCSHTDSLSLHDYDTHTNTQEDVRNSEKEFRDEEEERDKDGVSEEDVLFQVGLLIILSDFKWAGHRLAHMFADG